MWKGGGGESSLRVSFFGGWEESNLRVSFFVGGGVKFKGKVFFTGEVGGGGVIVLFLTV